MRSPLRVLGVVGVALVIGASCSGGDDASPPASTASATSTAGAASTDTPTSAVVPVPVTQDQSIGPPKPGEIPTPPPPACTLASTDEVSSVTGAASLHIGIDEGFGYRRCDYSDAADVLVATVEVKTQYAKPKPVDAFATLAAAGDAEVVPGYGDQAVYSGGSLYVLVGIELVRLTLEAKGTMADPAARRAATIALGAIAAPRFVEQEA